MVVGSYSSHLYRIATPVFNQGLLDKALQLNTSAREVFEFTMRCARAHSRSTSGSAVSGSSVGGSAGGSIDSAQSKEDGKRRGSDRTEASSSVIESKRAFAARTTDQVGLLSDHFLRCLVLCGGDQPTDTYRI